MHSYNKALLCSALWLTTHSFAFAGQTLADIYALATVNDPDIRAAAASYNAGKEQLHIGRSALKPQVSAHYSYSRSDEDSSSEFPFSIDNDDNPATPNLEIINSTQTSAVDTGNNWGVAINQTLFDVNTWQQAKQGQARSQTAHYEYQRAQQQLMLRVSQAYIAVLQAANDVNVAKAQLSADKAQLEQTQERFNVGAVARTDLHQAQAAYDLSTALLLSSEARLSNEQRGLSIIIGQDPQQLMTLAEDFVPVPPSPAAPTQWQDQAGSQNLSVKIAQSQRDTAKAVAKAAGANRLPTVNAKLAYDDRDTETDDSTFGLYNNSSNGTSFSLNLSLPLYAGGALGARKREAQALYNRSIEYYAGAVRRAQQQALSAYNDVVIDVASIKARKQALTSARSAADSIEAGYEAGSHSIIDLLAAKRAYHSAVRDYGNTRLDYLLNSLELKQLAGSLSGTDIEQLSAHLTHNVAVNSL